MKVKFHGILKKLCPKEFYEVVADTPAEAIRGVTMQLKSLRRISGNRWTCRVKECPKRDDLYAHNEQDFEVNLYPDYSPAGGGGGKTGIIQICIGVVLIAAAIVTTIFTGGFAGGFWAGMAATFASGTFAGTCAMMGVGMILSGVATMIATPELDTEASSASESKSRAFGINKNTTDIGTRIAIGYGKYKVYGQFLSINTETYDS